MRKWLSILLLTLMSLPFSWAALASHASHATQQYHTQHAQASDLHHALSDTNQTGHELNCSTHHTHHCHANWASFIPRSHLLLLQPDTAHGATYYRMHDSQVPSRRLERPKWWPPV